MKVSSLYCSYPRWVDESGLPEKISATIDPAAWLVYKKFLEIELEQNLLPDWFVVTTKDLVRWIGVSPETLTEYVETFINDGMLTSRSYSLPDEGNNWFKFPNPIPAPLSEEEIRKNLANAGMDPGEFLLRHLTPRDASNRVQQVIDLYQRCFGTRMNSRILKDLHEIAERFPFYLVRDAFTAAKDAEKYSLNWIITRLYKGKS